MAGGRRVRGHRWASKINVNGVWQLHCTCSWIGYGGDEAAVDHGYTAHLNDERQRTREEQR